MRDFLADWQRNMNWPIIHRHIYIYLYKTLKYLTDYEIFWEHVNVTYLEMECAMMFRR